MQAGGYLPLTTYKTNPTIMERTRILDNPARAIIPSTDNTHKINNTEAIWRNGLGRIPITQTITANMTTSHKVIMWPLNLKSITLSTSNGPYPSNQSKSNITMSANNINSL